MSLSAYLQTVKWGVADIVYLHCTQGWDNNFARTLEMPSVNNVILFCILARVDFCSQVQVTTTEDQENTNYQKIGFRSCKNIWKVCDFLCVQVVAYHFTGISSGGEGVRSRVWY